MAHSSGGSSYLASQKSATEEAHHDRGHVVEHGSLAQDNQEAEGKAKETRTRYSPLVVCFPTFASSHHLPASSKCDSISIYRATDQVRILMI